MRCLHMPAKFALAFRLLGMAGTAVLVFSVSTSLWNRVGAALAVEPVLRAADAIVVLGAGIESDGTLSPESLKRAMHGIRLSQRGLAPVLVFSGPANGRNRRTSEAEARRRMAIQSGVPADRIVVVSGVRTTRDESVETAAALAPYGAGAILLVTESLHMRRSMMVFREAGFEVFPAPSDDYPGTANSPGARLRLMGRILEQGGALLYYRLAGYI